MRTSGHGQSNYDLSFKILLIGDSAVGKSSSLITFVSNVLDDLAPTIDKVAHSWREKIETYNMGDTAGQERFRTLTSSCYRGAQGIILVYDVTKRDTFTNLSDVWVKELELYSSNKDCIKILVGNKVDRESEQIVSRGEGMTLAKELGCLFLECSAKTRENVEQYVEVLALKITEVPRFLE